MTLQGLGGWLMPGATQHSGLPLQELQRQGSAELGMTWLKTWLKHICH